MLSSEAVAGVGGVNGRRTGIRKKWEPESIIEKEIISNK